MIRSVLTLGIFAVISAPLPAADCSQVPDAAHLKELLAKAPNSGGDEGGLFHGKQEWAATVNRDGQVCAFAACPWRIPNTSQNQWLADS
jgi:hypothetical protein